MKAQLNKSMKEVLGQIKKADQVLKDLKEKVVHIDKQAARARLEGLAEEGLKEASKLRDRMQHQLVDLTKDLAKASVKMKDESERIRGRVEDSLKVVKAQIKTLTEKERTKRRDAKE